jgi:hypothetical protein
MTVAHTEAEAKYHAHVPQYTKSKKKYPTKKYITMTQLCAPSSIGELPMQLMMQSSFLLAYGNLRAIHSLYRQGICWCWIIELCL